MSKGKVIRLNENCLKYLDEVRNLLPRFLRSDSNYLNTRDIIIIEESLRSYVEMINFDLEERGE